MAPRLGAAYDLFGDGRIKVFGSWGRYYDWTKYELPRGSFGAETWCIYYRGLDTLDLGNLNLSNMPGRTCGSRPGSCRDRRVPSFDSIDPDIQPMKQDEHQRRRGIPARPQRRAHARTTSTTTCSRRSRTWVPDANGDEVYVIGNPGERHGRSQFADRR